jgi:hypothetical protein
MAALDWSGGFGGGEGSRQGQRRLGVQGDLAARSLDGSVLANLRRTRYRWAALQQATTLAGCSTARVHSH